MARAPRTPSSSRSSAPRPPLPPAPPLSRDRWAWLTLFALVPAVVHSLGAPFGEAVAEDFDFLHSALLLRRHGFFEGGGSLAFWRPLAHQVYYSVLGETILSHPRIIAFLHSALLGVGSLLLYRVLRRSWPGSHAAAAATFPLFLESVRELIAWPSHFVDLGSYFFAVLALHEAAFRRMPSALLSLLASLLCKESGVVVALLLPWMPGADAAKAAPVAVATGPDTAQAAHARESGARRPQRRSSAGTLWSGPRMHWTAGTLAVCLAWGIAYQYVRHRSGLELPHHLGSAAAAAGTPWLARLGWAAWNSLRAVASLPAAPAKSDWIYGAALGAPLLAAALWLAADRSARSRMRPAWAWTGWGVAWFAAFCAGLTVIFPIWAPYRALFGAIGLGIAVTCVLGAAHPALLATWLAVRAAAFAASPSPPPTITAEAPNTGAFLDFGRLVRLQRLMEDTRIALRSRFPSLPPGSRVGQHSFPLSAVYALGGDHALQVWYRDTTVHWSHYEDYKENPVQSVATIVEYQPHRAPQIVLVEPPAMGAFGEAMASLRRGDWAGMMVLLGRADSLQRDRNAVVFLATVGAKRALGHFELGRLDEAEREAQRAAELWSDNFDSGYVLASVALARGHLEEAERLAFQALGKRPNDQGTRELLARVRAQRQARAR